MTLACCNCIAHRYLVVLLSFIGMLISVGYRTSFALMVTHINAFNSSDKANSSGGESIFPSCSTMGTSRDRVVHWKGSTTSLFHTAYFIGQFVMSIPGGVLSTKFSPKKVFGITIFITSILQLLLPVSSEYKVWPIFVIRTVQGLIEAISVPAMNAVISSWAPRAEKARLINIAYAGVYLSPTVAMLTTGATLCYVSWDSIMYIYGSLGAVWSIIFMLVIASRPETHPRLRDDEQQLLLQPNIPKANTSIRSIPWGKFFTSLPVLAIWIAAVSRNVIFALLITEVQQYYKDVYHLSTAMIGLLSAIPHIFMVIFMLTGSCFFDMLVKHNILSVTNTRKLAQCSGFGIQGVCTLVIGFLDNHIQAFVLLCVGVAFSGFAISGYQTNPLDLAPQYAGPLTGISRTGMIGSVLCTLLASQLTGNSHDLIDWQHMFIIAGSIHLAGVIFYGIFASGSLQSWAQPSTPSALISRDVNANVFNQSKIHSNAGSKYENISSINEINDVGNLAPILESDGEQDGSQDEGYEIRKSNYETIRPSYYY